MRIKSDLEPVRLVNGCGVDGRESCEIHTVRARAFGAEWSNFSPPQPSECQGRGRGRNLPVDKSVLLQREFNLNEQL